jgi:hypothetical protein
MSRRGTSFGTNFEGLVVVSLGAYFGALGDAFRKSNSHTVASEIIQGSESQVPAGLYCNLLLCGIKSLALSRKLRSIITPVKPQLQPTFCHHHKSVASTGRPPSLLAQARCQSSILVAKIRRLAKHLEVRSRGIAAGFDQLRPLGDSALRSRFICRSCHVEVSLIIQIFLTIYNLLLSWFRYNFPSL